MLKRALPPSRPARLFAVFVRLILLVAPGVAALVPPARGHLTTPGHRMHGVERHGSAGTRQTRGFCRLGGGGGAAAAARAEPFDNPCPAKQGDGMQPSCYGLCAPTPPCCNRLSTLVLLWAVVARCWRGPAGAASPRCCDDPWRSLEDGRRVGTTVHWIAGYTGRWLTAQSAYPLGP